MFSFLKILEHDHALHIKQKEVEAIENKDRELKNYRKSEIVKKSAQSKMFDRQKRHGYALELPRSCQQRRLATKSIDREGQVFSIDREG